MRMILITAATLAMLAGPAMASYWDQCNKSRNQYYDEPFASREFACDALKACPARNKCYARLDADATASPTETTPKTMREATIDCEQDALESGADEKPISIEACAKRILSSTKVPKCRSSLKKYAATSSAGAGLTCRTSLITCYRSRAPTNWDMEASARSAVSYSPNAGSNRG